jgi:hypothetical protein
MVTVAVIGSVDPPSIPGLCCIINLCVLRQIQSFGGCTHGLLLLVRNVLFLLSGTSAAPRVTYEQQKSCVSIGILARQRNHFYLTVLWTSILYVHTFVSVSDHGHSSCHWEARPTVYSRPLLHCEFDSAQTDAELRRLYARPRFACQERLFLLSGTSAAPRVE